MISANLWASLTFRVVHLAQILAGSFKCRVQECQSVHSLHCLLVEVIDFGVCFCIGFVGLAETAFIAVQDLLQSPEILRRDIEEFAPSHFPRLTFVFFTT